MGVQERRERERQERRDAILVAAASVFLERGVGQTTMEDIARQAELSKGALYLYFKSKDELYLSIALSVLDELVVRLEEVARRSFPTGLDLAEATVQEYVRVALRHGSNFRVAMSWVSSQYQVDERSELFDLYRQRIASVHRAGVVALERARADGSLVTDIPTRRLSMQIWGSALGLVLLEQNGAQIERRVSGLGASTGLAAEYLRFFFAALRAGAPGATTTPPGASGKEDSIA